MTRAPERLPTAERSIIRSNPMLQALGREGERLKSVLAASGPVGPAGILGRHHRGRRDFDAARLPDRDRG